MPARTAEPSTPRPPENDPARPARTLREGFDRLYPQMPAWQRSMTVAFIRLHHAVAFLAAERLLRRWRGGGGPER
jgi:hypothetical protein